MKARAGLAIGAFLGALGCATPAPHAPLDLSPGTHHLRCAAVPQLLSGLHELHLTARTPTPEIDAAAVDGFLARLDPTKTFLLASDVEAARTRLIGAVPHRPNASCAAFLDVAKTVAARMAALPIAEIVTAAAAEPPKPGTTLSIGYPVDEAASKAKLTDVTASNIARAMRGGAAPADAQSAARIELERRASAAQKRPEAESLAALVDAYATSLDPHTTYLPEEEAANRSARIDARTRGVIGIDYTVAAGIVRVTAVHPGSAAEAAGIREGDVLVGVTTDGASVPLPANVVDVNRVLRGDVGSVVRIEIRRPASGGDGAGSSLVTVTRRDPAPTHVTYAMSDVEDAGRKAKIAVVTVPAMYGDALGDGSATSEQETRRALARAQQEGANAVVLDISRNGGGQIREGVGIAGLFLHEGAVAASVGVSGLAQPLDDPEDDVAWSGPLVLLTSRRTASAAELLALALHDTKRAVIVGADHTYGKGIGQSTKQLPPGLGSIYVTTLATFGPAGTCAQGVGVPSDIVLAPGPLDLAIAEATLPRAIAPRSPIAPFLSPDANGAGPAHFTPIDAATIAKLAARSTARLATDAKRKPLAEALAVALDLALPAP